MTMGNFDSRLLVSIIFEHSVKVDLHSIYPFFVRFCTFFFSRKKCSFSSAFLYVHIRTNQTITYWTKIFQKTIFVKGYSSILKHCSHRSYTKFWGKSFINIYTGIYRTPGLLASAISVFLVDNRRAILVT